MGMGKVKDYIFRSKKSPYPNVFVGGISAINSSAESFAGRLFNDSGFTLSSSEIKSFKIVGDNIECYIGVPYRIRPSAFTNRTDITYFRDEGRMCVYVHSSGFRNCDALSVVEMNGVLHAETDMFRGNSLVTTVELRGMTSVGGRVFYATQFRGVYLDSLTSIPPDTFLSSGGFLELYIPNASTLGDNSLNNGIFSGVSSATKIWCPTSLLTANGGGVEPDLAYAIGRGCEITYL